MKKDNELVQTILIQFSFPYQEMATEKEGENKSIPLPQGIANLAEHTVRQMILWKKHEIWSCDINIYKNENEIRNLPDKNDIICPTSVTGGSFLTKGKNFVKNMG